MQVYVKQSWVCHICILNEASYSQHACKCANSLETHTVKLQTINFERRVLLTRTNVKQCDQSLVTINDVSSTFFKGAKITL